MFWLRCSLLFLYPSKWSFWTIVLPKVSLLNEPNTSSPANVDASVMYRRWKDSRGKDKEYENIIRWSLASSWITLPWLWWCSSLFWIYLRAWRRQRWQSTTRWSGRREMHLQIGISTNLTAALAGKYYSCRIHVSSFSLYFFFACRHVFPLIWRTQHDKNLFFRKQVAASHTEADKDQVVVPLTMEE